MTKETEKNIKDMLVALEEDTDFQALKQKYEAPNCVSIMGRTRREEWHSNFVNWLLDPNGNHGLGTFPLERFLDLIERKSKDEKEKIDRKDIAEMRFQTEFPIGTKMKNGRIDILGENKSLVIVIENKIKSKENEYQSNLYYEYFERRNRNQKKWYVHLTSEPQNRLENESFIIVTYQELFDSVIKYAYEKCDDLKKENTKRVLEQYAVDISNPLLYEAVMAYTEKEKAERIYQMHENTIELIRQTMNDIDRDEKSDICEFYWKYEKYINEMVLVPIGKCRILPETGGKLEGKELILRLCGDGYVKPGITKLIYHRHKGTYVIMIDENFMCYAGFCDNPNYNGSEDVDLLVCGETIHKAAAAIEKVIHPPINEDIYNGGLTPYKMELCNAGNNANGKKIGELYPKWFNS